MNLLAALWRFGGRRSTSVGADTDSHHPQVCSDDVDSGSWPDCLGAAPVIDGDIELHPGAPSTLARCPEPEPEPSATHRRWEPPSLHAELLLQALLHWGFGGHRRFTSAAMMYCHETLCSRLGLRVEPWPVVSAELRKLLNQKKTYSWFRKYDGDRVRLRTFNVPRRMPSKLRLVSGGAA